MQRTVNVEIKKLRDYAIIPKYAHGFEDSGMDVFVADVAAKDKKGEWVESKEYTIKPNETVLVKTGIAMTVPIGTEAQVRPTSGNSLKTMLRVANAPGTVDAGYRDEIGVIITNIGNDDITISRDDKIAQIVICPIYHANLLLVDEFSTDSDRGLNGFGSTGTIKDVDTIEETEVKEEVKKSKTTKKNPSTKATKTSKTK